MNCLNAAPPRLIRRLAQQTLFVRLYSYDHLVIGAGVVGLAVAAKLAEYVTQQSTGFTVLPLGAQSLPIW
jgi:hypothetical protein